MGEDGVGAGGFEDDPQGTVGGQTAGEVLVKTVGHLEDIDGTESGREGVGGAQRHAGDYGDQKGSEKFHGSYHCWSDAEMARRVRDFTSS